MRLKMFDHLKALWYMSDRLESFMEEVRNYKTDITHSGIGLAELERQMIREVHNLITAKLEGYLEAENRRINAEAMSNIEANRRVILEKGERLKAKDFSYTQDQKE